MIRAPRWPRALLLTALCGAWLGASAGLGLAAEEAPAAEESAAAEVAAEAAAEEPVEEEPSDPTPAELIRAKLLDFTRLRTEIKALLQVIDAAEGIERDRISVQARERWTEAIRRSHELTDELVDAREAGEELGEIDAQVVAALHEVTESLPRILDRGNNQLQRLRTEFETADATQSIVIRDQITRVIELRAMVARHYLEHIADLEAIGVDPSDARADLGNRMQVQAESLASRLQVSADRLRRARERESDSPKDTERIEAARMARSRVDLLAGSLKSTVEIMSALDLDTASYRRQMIESTGQISGDILNREVAAGLIERWSASGLEWARSNTPTLLFRLVLFTLVLFLTGAVARLVRHLVERAVSGPRTRMTQLARQMVINISGRTVWILGILVAISQLGIQIGPLLAGLGVAGFIIGFALQDTLGNFASGAMLLIYRPYDVGDMVDVAGGVYGSVSHMSLVSTTILTIDNQTLVIPNSKIWGDVIKNVTAQRNRRVDMVFGISYGDNILEAQQIFESILKEHPKVLDDPESVVRVHELGDSSVNFVVRPWVRTGDYWDVYWDVTREVKLRLDREGITIPFPQQDVHFHPVAAASEIDLDPKPAPVEAPIQQASAGKRAGDVDGQVGDA